MNRHSPRALLALLFSASFLMVAGSACAPLDGGAPTVTGATESEVRAQLGPPTHEVKPPERPQATLLTYPQQLAFQVEAGQVVLSHRTPASREERQLQYWRQRWRGKTQYRMPAQGTEAENHEQLHCPSEQLTITFDKRDGRVVGIDALSNL